MMIGPLLLLAVSTSPIAPLAAPSKPAAGQRASATATATVRIISGVRFGSSHQSGAAGADRRKAQLVDSDGFVRPAELLEFQ